MLPLLLPPACWRSCLMRQQAGGGFIPRAAANVFPRAVKGAWPGRPRHQGSTRAGSELPPEKAAASCTHSKASLRTLSFSASRLGRVHGLAPRTQGRVREFKQNPNPNFHVAQSGRKARLTAARLDGKMKNCDRRDSAHRTRPIAEMRQALHVPKWRNWQTRYIQGVVPVREWRFESSLRHHQSRNLP